ncbi:MAG: DUF4190 domain-containing protein [Leucobacter sp.]|nr:DUF4190 domain-containing protein [Leucobacter sp.]
MTQMPPEHNPNETPGGATPDPNAELHAPQQDASYASPQYAPPAQGWQQEQEQQPSGYPQQPGQPQPGGYPQPGYGQYGYPAPQQYAPVVPPMNVFAIVGFVGVFFAGIVGVVFGHIALSKIKRSGEGGRGFALAAVIIGYVRVVFTLLGTIMFFAFFGIFGAFSSTVSGSSDFGTDPYGNSEHSEREESHGEEFSEEWNQRFSEMPWIGTANEELCTAMFAPEVSIFEDPAVYYTELLAVTTDPELTALAEKMLEFSQTESLDTAEDAQDRANAEAEWAEASSGMAIVCMGDDSARN